MNGRRRFDIIEHLSEAELDTAINEAQMADEARPVRLCFVKNLYAGDVLEEAARRVGISQANSSRWAHAWNASQASDSSTTDVSESPRRTEWKLASVSLISSPDALPADNERVEQSWIYRHGN